MIFQAIVVTICLCVFSYGMKQISVKMDNPTEASFVDTTCILPADSGKKCPNTQIRRNESESLYYFNTNKSRCTSFTYYGCEGNGNRFESFDLCVDACQTPWFINKNNSEGNEDNTVIRRKSDCKLKPEPGNCKALITMWYFNSTTSKCSGFGYGGCGGNGNRFIEENECLTFCK